MQTQVLYIDASTGSVSAQCNTPVEPALFAILGTTLSLSVAFTIAGTPAAIVDYSASTLRLVMKPMTEPDAATGLLPVGTWGSTGSGASTRYTWSALANSVQLIASLGSLASQRYTAQIEWGISTDTNLRKSQPFEILIINSPARLDDGAADIAATAAWDWLKARLAAGANITLSDDDGTQITTIAAATGTVPADTGWAAWTGTTDKTTHGSWLAATVSASPTQAEVQAISDALQQVSQSHAALVNILMTGYLPGA